MDQAFEEFMGGVCDNAQATLDTVDCNGVTAEQAQIMLTSAFSNAGVDGVCELSLCGASMEKNENLDLSSLGGKFEIQIN